MRATHHQQAWGRSTLEQHETVDVKAGHSNLVAGLPVTELKAGNTSLRGSHKQDRILHWTGVCDSNLTVAFKAILWGWGEWERRRRCGGGWHSRCRKLKSFNGGCHASASRCWVPRCSWNSMQSATRRQQRHLYVGVKEVDNLSISGGRFVGSERCSGSLPVCGAVLIKCAV